MGSSSVQSQLWGEYPREWASIQEPTSLPGYEYVLDHLRPEAGEMTLLDIGCGSGLFASMAARKGYTVTGIDATPNLIGQASLRTPSITFTTGEMEELPFPAQSFAFVSSFNAFQYAASIGNALAEARRVLKDNGALVVMIWGNKDACEASAYLKAVGGLLPPPPPGAGGPFALSEDQVLEQILDAAGFVVDSKADIPIIWDYPDEVTAIKGLLSAGPAVKAIQHSGYDAVYASVALSCRPYTRLDGHVIFHNAFRIVLASKKR